MKLALPYLATVEGIEYDTYNFNRVAVSGFACLIIDRKIRFDSLEDFEESDLPKSTKREIADALQIAAEKEFTDSLADKIDLRNWVYRI